MEQEIKVRGTLQVDDFSVRVRLNAASVHSTAVKAAARLYSETTQETGHTLEAAAELAGQFTKLVLVAQTTYATQPNGLSADTFDALMDAAVTVYIKTPPPRKDTDAIKAAVESAEDLFREVERQSRTTS